MSFWELSDGKDASTEGTGEFDDGSGSLELIPDNTSVLAFIDEAKWDRNRENQRYISLRWAVLAPEELKNRKVFQKLWVDDLDTAAKDPIKKRDKAKLMLRAIDTNAGGKLSMLRQVPSDVDLTASLTNKPMVVKVLVWSVKDRETGQTVNGNRVGAVSPKTAPISTKEEILSKPPVQSASSGGGASGGSTAGNSSKYDDEIPF